MAQTSFYEWVPKALGAVSVYMGRHRGTYFIADDLIMWTRVHGFSQPVDPRAWGPVLQEAADMGMIRKVSNYGKAPHRKMGRCSIWSA